MTTQPDLTPSPTPVADAERPNVIFWEAFAFDSIRLLPFGIFQDAVVRAGGELLFPEATDAQPVSKEQIATSDVDVVLALDYGETTEPLLPQMEDLIVNTPAADGLGVVPVTNYPPNLHAVDLVEEIARAIHPDLFP